MHHGASGLLVHYYYGYTSWVCVPDGPGKSPAVVVVVSVRSQEHHEQEIPSAKFRNLGLDNMTVAKGFYSGTSRPREGDASRSATHGYGNSHICILEEQDQHPTIPLGRHACLPLPVRWMTMIFGSAIIM